MSTDGEMWRVLDRYAELYGPVELTTKNIGAANETHVMKIVRAALFRGSPLSKKELEALEAAIVPPAGGTVR